MQGSDDRLFQIICSCVSAEISINPSQVVLSSAVHLISSSLCALGAFCLQVKVCCNKHCFLF